MRGRTWKKKEKNEQVAKREMMIRQEEQMGERERKIERVVRASQRFPLFPPLVYAVDLL